MNKRKNNIRPIRGTLQNLCRVVMLLVCVCTCRVMTGAGVCAQEHVVAPKGVDNSQIKGYMVPATVDSGDTIPLIRLKPIYCFAPLRFASERERVAYIRLLRDVKRTLPFAKLVASTMIETYEYMETLPSEKERNAHLKRMERELFEQYKPELKKLTLRQGKLLLKLIARECNSTSYELIDAFLGSFSANFWNVFAKMFGATLKSDYDPYGQDAGIERAVLMVESGAV